MRSSFGFVLSLLLVLTTGACDSSTEPQLNQLNVTIAGSGSGQVTLSTLGASGSTCGTASSTSCIARYSSSELVTMGATPATGSVFAGWSGACTGTGACVLAMSGSRNVTATFNLQ
ncbi:MAG TPA: hypothetical protein VFO52_04920 [Longimicrobiales bacterium]|nr:hypothetical protein [Longimicrobiales bacterium]